jgi:hypothetical protein
MSRFNDYAKKLNEIANGTFEEYRRAEAAVKSAESRYNAYPRRNGADPAYMAKSARAEADLAEARNAFEQMRRHLFEEQRKDIAVIRAELVEALGKEYAADPKAVDGNTLALMNSGIMTADEYSRLIDSAIASGNFTMTRLLAKSAADMAEKTTGDADVSRSYRLASQKGKGMDGREYLQAFDFLTDTFNRCERNFALTTKWDELTSPVVDSF